MKLPIHRPGGHCVFCIAERMSTKWEGIVFSNVLESHGLCWKCCEQGNAVPKHAGRVLLKSGRVTPRQACASFVEAGSEWLRAWEEIWSNRMRVRLCLPAATYCIAGHFFAKWESSSVVCSKVFLLVGSVGKGRSAGPKQSWRVLQKSGRVIAKQASRHL